MAENKKIETKEIQETVAKSSAPKPPKKLIPRTAPKSVTPDSEAVVELIAAPVVDALVAAAVKPQPRRVKKVDVELEATNVRNKQAMSDALAKAQAVKIAQPLGKAVPAPELPKTKKQQKTAKPEKVQKMVKVKKVKLIRDSYAMPDSEYAVIGTLKKRLAALGGEFKKSEILRAGIAVLAALGDSELQVVMGRVERIKTGRPSK